MNAILLKRDMDFNMGSTWKWMYHHNGDLLDQHEDVCFAWISCRYMDILL